ncbi:hypothetical protein GCG21_04850 [Pseudactinotalea sp. HY160]|uniref:hypothetical protein n=1 Tax=Pseudactinotalea sp. HY160 TaxID=2654490 RepID=UPI00128BFEAF|nr:hypothetical protein [Pseudactinotalea sp. HY160]MPV49342.1 hypothetical protein [Pseudactinotalea sp. HY160]
MPTPLLVGLIAVVALVVSGLAGSPLVRLLLAPNRHRRPGGGELDPAEVLRGGRWIGILERVATTGAILVGYPAAIAVIVAIKGLGRFPELRAGAGVSERFIIGTLASLLWAAALGVAGSAAVSAVV